MMKKVYLNLIIVIMASLSLAGCIKSDKSPDVPWVAPAEGAKTGSGFLKVGVGDAAVTTKSSYSWSMDGTTIKVDVTVDLEQYVNGDENVPGGAFEVGNFLLPEASAGDFTGALVSELDETTFYAVQPDGTAVDEMTSYKPGMWVDGDGYSCGWSTGAMFWQWFVWEGKTDKNGDVIGYDYSAEENGSLLLIGSNPSNVVAQAGKTVTSKAKIVSDNVTYDFIVNVTFSEFEQPETEGYPNVPMTGAGYPFPYSCGVSGENQFSWYADENGVYVFADIYSPTVISDEAWEVMGFVIDTTELADAFSIKMAKSDISNFYPVEPDGTPGTAWTSYVPGQWVTADGSAADYSTGAMFWQYQINGNYYDGHYTEGLLLIGTNPGNISALGGQTVTSKAKFFGKDWIVNVTYHDTYPTSGSGNIGAHSYSWELTSTGVNIVANCSASLLDESWAWFGFPLNEAYINNYYSINIDDLSGGIAAYGNTTADGFYPVNSTGERYTEWSSYGPGMWFGADGNKWSWDYASWGNFWQYYTVVEHEWAIPNLMLLGNWGGPTYNTAGTSATSKAILNGTLEWNVTLNIVE